MGATVRTILLFSVLSFLLAVAGVVISAGLGTDPISSVALFLLLAVLLNLVAIFLGDRIVLWSYRASEVSPTENPRLHSLVERVAQSARLPKPKVYKIPSRTPNAFATGISPRRASVAFTEGILDLLDERELEGVVAHEISHIRHRDTLVMVAASTIAGAIAAMFRAAFWGSLFGGRDRNLNPFVLLFVGFLASIVALLLQLAISRAREFKADEGAAKLTGRPLDLAMALKKLERGNRAMPLDGNPAHSSLFIVNPLSSEGMARLLSTHPPIEERVRRLEKMAYSI